LAILRFRRLPLRRRLGTARLRPRQAEQPRPAASRTSASFRSWEAL